jgi:predicted restriction endonuclease
MQSLFESTNEERLNAYNGVLLCYDHDALYDKGFNDGLAQLE